MDDMPDLSHLTPEERAIIEGVIMRQRQEEQREHEIMRRKQDEVAVLEQTIRTRNEMQRAAGVELAATCHICLKTKFADGIGHSCHYCRVRCCARCGGKVTLRSNKVIWVCILCRKKQELLSKTGQWIHKSAGQDTMLWQMESDLRGLPSHVDTSLDKRPKLERAHSAAEKENQPLQRSGSALRRQYSQQEARCYGELEGLARTHPHLVHPRQKASYGVEDTGIPLLPPQSQLLPLPHTPGVHPPLPPRSSSSDDEVPECVSDENDEYRDRGNARDRSAPDGTRRQRQAILDEKMKKFLSDNLRRVHLFGTHTCAAPAWLPTIITISLIIHRPRTCRRRAERSIRQGRLRLAVVASTRSQTVGGALVMMARARICDPTSLMGVRVPIVPFIRVPTCGKTPPITDVSRKGEKKQSASTATKVLRRSLVEVAMHPAPRTTGPPCAGSPRDRPARTLPPKTRASILLALSLPAKTRTGAIALSFH